VSHKTSLWWRTLDCVRIQLLFDWRLDIDDNGLPLPGIVLVGSPVGSDDFLKQHLIAKSTKVDVVLGMIAEMRKCTYCDATTSLLSLRRSLHIGFRSTPPRQTLPAAAMLDKQQRFWIDRLLPGLPPLTTARLRQAALPIKDGGLGNTVPSDVVELAYIGSRLDTADAVAPLPRMRDAVAAMKYYFTLLTDHVAANQVSAPLGGTGWDVPTLRTSTRQETQHTLQRHVHECRGRSVWPTRHASIADV
jgi:hypothetical protein